MFQEKYNFSFIEELEQHWSLIQQEVIDIDREQFLSWPEKHLYEKGWNVFGLIAFGVQIDRNCRLCPHTTKLVNKIPGLVTAGFSALEPGTHIAAHTGYPDGVLRCHLGLIGCEDCYLRVGEETRSWEEGKCLVFDDTTEHEVWHKGSKTRVVLLLDFRYPLADSSSSFLRFFQNIFNLQKN